MARVRTCVRLEISIRHINVRQGGAGKDRADGGEQAPLRPEVVELEHIDRDDDDDAEHERQAELREQEERNRVARPEAGAHELGAGVFDRLAGHQAEMPQRPARHVQRLDLGAPLRRVHRLAEIGAPIGDRLDTALGRRFLEQRAPDDDDADSDEGGGPERDHVLEPQAGWYEMS